MDVLRDVGLWVAGLVLVVIVVDAAIRTFVLPRGTVVRLTRMISIVVRVTFDTALRFSSTYRTRDRVMALYAPIVLVCMVVTWVVLLFVGFACIFEAVLGQGWAEAFTASGSSLFTLGFERPGGNAGIAVAFTAATFGLGVVALLIAYLPTIYGSFSQRERLVAYFATRAGTPPTAVELLQRAHLIDRLHDLDDLWERYQLWFAEIEETHTSLPLLNFFRSPSPDRSWITTAGAVLDAGSLINSTVDAGWHPMAGLCVRSGYIALRSIGDFFGIEYSPDPQPDDPITIGREEWEQACAELESVGVPLRADRDQAWRDFAGWRVNYDTLLVTLAGLLAAPYAPWSSDRSVRYRVRVGPRGRSRRG
ncbi:MAG: hypothetical protein ACXVJ7_04455 [Acidimicrobiia bacterium]